MTTKPTGTGQSGLLSGLPNSMGDSIRGRKVTRLSHKRVTQKPSIANSLTRESETPIKLMKVSHAMTLIYIALLLAFSIVAVQNNRVRKAHNALKTEHDALYVGTQAMRLEASEIISPIAIRYWAKEQGMIPYYSSTVQLEQINPNDSSQLNTGNIAPLNFESQGQ